jgi:hypothetical protein
MASISLTGINGRGNFSFPLLGALARSPSHGEVGGRLFFVWWDPTFRPRSLAVAG